MKQAMFLGWESVNSKRTSVAASFSEFHHLPVTTPLHCFFSGKSEQRLEQKFGSEVDAIETWLQY